MKKLRWKIAQFFERLWWIVYVRNKNKDNYLSWKKNYWKTLLNELNITDKIEAPVLDVGCGPAGIYMVLGNKEVDAIDPLLNAYKSLAIFSPLAYPDTHFINQNFESYKTHKKYETVFCLNAINHFIDINYSFKKLYDLMAKDAKLILSVDAHNYPIFNKLFSLLPFDILHPHQYNLVAYEEFLVNNDFIIVAKHLKKKEFFFSYWIIHARKK